MHFKQPAALFPLGHFCIVVQPREETERSDGASSVYTAEGNKVWQLHGTNDWITLSHCQGVILTLNKEKNEEVWYVCVCQWARPEAQ